MTQRLITSSELLQAPTGFNWADVSENGTATAIEAIEQANVIDRASAIIRGHLGMDPTPTTDTEVARLGGGSVKAWVDRAGWLWFKTDNFPILSLTSLKWATVPAGSGGLTYTALTAANVQIYGESFRLNRLIDFSQDWTWLRECPGLVQAVYVNGWPNMLLAAAIAAGSSVTCEVDSTTGLTATVGAIGNQLTIYDGANTEVITVASIADTTHFVASSVAHAHDPSATPIGISALPSDIKQACIWTCLGIARTRGTTDLKMDPDGGIQGFTPGAGLDKSDAWEKAKELLVQYRRMA